MMKFKRSILDSGCQKIDREQVGLVFEFIEADNDQLDMLYQFICKDVICKLSAQFLLDIDEEMDRKLLPKRSFSKNGKSVSAYSGGNLTVSGVFKSTSLKGKRYRSYGGAVNAYYAEHLAEMKSEEYKHSVSEMNTFHYKKPEELLEKIQELIGLEQQKIMDYSPLLDMMLLFEFNKNDSVNSCSYNKYYGNFEIIFCGYALDYQYDEVTQYLKDVLQSVGKILPIVTGNIFLEPKDTMCNYPLKNYFREKTVFLEEGKEDEFLEEILERQNRLKRIEWINFVPRIWKNRIKKELWKDRKYSILEDETGILVEIDKPIQKVTMQDRLELRKLLNDIMLKGSSLWIVPEWRAIRSSFEALPIFQNEIYLATNGKNEAILFLSDGDEQYLQEYDEDFPESDYKMVFQK